MNFFKNKWFNLTNDAKFSEIFTGSKWALSAQVLSAGLGIISSIIVARFYGADMLGVVAVLSSFLGIVKIFTVMGTATSILRLIPEHIAKYSLLSAFFVYRKTQFLVIVVSVVTSTLLYFSADFVATNIFSKPHLSVYFALGAGFVLFNSLMNLNTAAVRGLRMIRAFALMRLMPNLSKVTILVLLTIFFFHQNNPVYAFLGSIAATAIVGLWIVLRAFQKKRDAKTTVYRMSSGQILNLSLPMLMANTMFFLIGQTGVILLGVFRPEAEVGYYSVAFRLAALAAFILQAINSIIGPKFSALYHAGNIDELFYVARKSTKLIFWTTTPIFLGLIIIGYPAIRLLYGEGFKAAYSPMIILIVGQFISSISGSVGYFLNMTGHHKMFRNIVAVAAIINFLVNLILIPLIGINGAAVAAMVSLIFWNLTSLFYIKKLHGKHIGYIPILSKV